MGDISGILLILPSGRRLIPCDKTQFVLLKDVHLCLHCWLNISVLHCLMIILDVHFELELVAKVE